jgi:hypothetical protein
MFSYISFRTLTSNSSFVYNHHYHPTPYSRDIEEASLNIPLKEEMKECINITASRTFGVGETLVLLLAQNPTII